MKAVNNWRAIGEFISMSICSDGVDFPKVVQTFTIFPVSSIVKGSTFNYRITVFNAGDVAAENVEIHDILPSGVIVNSVDSLGWDCEVITSLEYICSLTGPLLEGSSSYIDFEVLDISASDVTQLQNFVEVSADNADLQSTINIVDFNQSSFNVNISLNPGLVEVNSVFDVVIEVDNTGSHELTGIQVVNTIPSGFSYVSAVKNTSTCTQNGLEMTCTFDSPIAVATIGTITIPVLAIETIDPNVSYNNFTIVNSPDLSSPLTINTQIDFSEEPGNFDVSLIKSASINEVLVNHSFQYLLTVKNEGSHAVTDLRVVDNLPVGLQFDSVIAPDWSCSGVTQIMCTKDSMAVGSESDIILNVTAPSQSGLMNNIAQVSINEEDANGANDASQVSVSVVDELTPIADLSITVNALDDINQGDILNFEILAKNNGPFSADNPELDIAVTGLIETITVGEGSDWTCQVLSLSIHCQFKTEQMLSGQESPLNITVNTTEIIMDSEDIIVTANILSITQDSDSSNNTDSSIIVVEQTPDEDDFENALDDAIGSSSNPQTAVAVENVSSFCEQNFFSALDGLCGSLYEAALAGNQSEVSTFIEQITPNEIIAQSTSVAEIATAQFKNIGSRLSQLRSGGNGFSTAGLTARYGSGSIPLGMLAYLKQSADTSDDGSSSGSDFISPWGFFVNGTLSMGEKDATGRELGFDFDTYGLTTGIDYRIDNAKVIGVAIGYARFESSIGDTAELDSKGLTITGYGSINVNEKLYIDARVSYGNPEFEQSRGIDFTLGDRHIQKIAIGDTSADQYSVSMSAGYSFNKNAWNITPNASYSYVKTSIDGFTESGAGDFNFIFAEQDLNSLVWSTGLIISRAISLKNGVITPQFDINYNYESKNDSKDIIARFVNAPSDELFIIATDSPDRNFGSAGIGLVYISSNGKQAYINYKTTLAVEDFSRDTINFGFRFEF